MDDALQAMSDAVLAIAAERRVDPVLQKLVDSARSLAGARYAAIGIPDGDGGFATFITSGMTDSQYEALGELPRTHGMLGAMLQTPEPYRAPNIQDDPRFEGWPPQHPNMRTFLGVPIVSRGEVIGAFYLTEKKGERNGGFSGEDEGERRLPHDVEKGLLRIAQEALGNALRHADASRVALSLASHDSRIALRVADDGRGFDPEEAEKRSRRLGLTSMRERAEALGGTLAIDSRAGDGTTVTVEVELGRPDSRPRR